MTRGRGLYDRKVEHPAVLECAISAVPDADRGQIVKATIVLAKGFGASEALKKELQDHKTRHCTLQISAYDRICGATA